MITLRWDEGFAPKYMSPMSAAADLVARDTCVIEVGSRVLVPTGVWIESVDHEKIPSGTIPELQIRARSGRAYREGLWLVNGVGTIDADYRDEICVLAGNCSHFPITVQKGERIAQIVMQLVFRIPNLVVTSDPRLGGFGSSGLR